MRHRTLPVLLALSFSACVTTRAIQLGTPGKYPPVDHRQVQVFLREDDVQVPFDKVALIESSGQYDQVEYDQMVTAMKKKAAKLGANAIVLGDFRDPTVIAVVAQKVLGVSAERKANVLAIRLLE